MSASAPLLAVTVACSASVTSSLDGGRDANAGGSDAGDAGSTGESDSGRHRQPSECSTQILCGGHDESLCCGPPTPSTCVDGVWMCGAIKAPGCNGNACPAKPPPCPGSPPECFGFDDTACCTPKPVGVAICSALTTSFAWVCGSVAAPGCNGKVCGSGSDAGGGDAAGGGVHDAKE